MQKRIRHNTGDTLCRQCHDQPETLTHILNHYPPYVGMMRARHNNIVKRLTKALPNDAGDEVYIEQVVAGDTNNLKPDMVVLNRTTKIVTVLDVAIPFDTEKTITKYAYFKTLLEEKGYKKVTVEASIIGSLGS